MEEIGRRLREAREARGIALATAEDETKIRRKYIEALESGREADLPGEAYLKGFLRTYGNYLGLDGPAMVEAYKERKEPLAQVAAPVAPVQEARRQQPRPDPKPEQAHADRQPAKPAERRSAPASGGESVRNAAIAALVVAVVAVVAFAGWLIAGQPGGKNTPPPQDNPPPPVTDTKQPDPPPPPKLPDPPKVTMTRGTGKDVFFVQPGAQAMEVIFEPTGGQVWTEVTIDGGKPVQQTLRQVTTFKGKEIRIVAGHMNGVHLVVNGQRFEKPLDGSPIVHNLIFRGE